MTSSGDWILQDPNVRYAKIDEKTMTMSYKCPSCKDTHTHGAQGEKLYHATDRWSHCPAEDFKGLRIVPI
jgi:hypothetical protein